MADGNKHKPVGVGPAAVLVTNEHGQEVRWLFEDAIYDPQSPTNLLCVERFLHRQDGTETDLAIRTPATTCRFSVEATRTLLRPPLSPLHSTIPYTA